jgi:hypothetical protein
MTREEAEQHAFRFLGYMLTDANFRNELQTTDKPAAARLIAQRLDLEEPPTMEDLHAMGEYLRPIRDGLNRHAAPEAAVFARTMNHFNLTQ